MTKEEIAQNKQFILLPQCFPLLVIGYPFFTKYVQSRLLQNCCMSERVKQLNGNEEHYGKHSPSKYFACAVQPVFKDHPEEDYIPVFIYR